MEVPIPFRPRPEADVADEGRDAAPAGDDGNPARRSPLLMSLFPAGVAAAEWHGNGTAAQLHAGERQDIGQSVARRVGEFTAGRLCVRRAAVDLGIDAFTLRVGADRSPQWPSSLIGSITHTEGFRGAVLARRGTLRALGVDAEVIGRVTPELWPQICTPAEAAWLYSLADAQRASAAALIFSAKEAFYKCQYPLTHAWLDFHDLSMNPLVIRSGSPQDFSLCANTSRAGGAGTLLPLQGRYTIAGTLMLTAVTLCA